VRFSSVSIGLFVTIWRRSSRKIVAILAALTIALALPGESRASQPVTFRTDDGVVLSATWYEPATRGPAVILVHMLHRSRRDFDALASRLASEGIGALALDLRGHGDSQGSVGQDFAPMVGDVKAARRFLAGRSDVSGKIGLLGASLGANLAALEAADDPAVASLALLSPSLDYRGLRIETAMRKYGARPVLMVVSDDDPYASRSAHDLEKGTRGREILSLSGAGHGSTMLERDQSLMGSLVDWFRRTLL
jgi:alpha-beta hydrolase superfamily lysophospholipase